MTRSIKSRAREKLKNILGKNWKIFGKFFINFLKMYQFMSETVRNFIKTYKKHGNNIFRQVLAISRVGEAKMVIFPSKILQNGQKSSKMHIFDHLKDFEGKMTIFWLSDP